MKILVINSGSSSIKYQLFDMHTSSALASGLLERIGEPEGRQSHHVYKSDGSAEEVVEDAILEDHQEGIKKIASWLTTSGSIKHASELFAICHRVAHGGAEFTEPTVINQQVQEAIRRQIPLAPLHNPANLCGIEVTMTDWPDTPQVAIFDTAFHHSIPEYAYQYALPFELTSKHHIRRYGFHGTSHKYVSEQAAQHLDRPLSKVNLIVLHLGNGASVAAVRGGQSIDTSMGMTPLEGLMMGTRCGDLDPGVVLHLAQVAGMSVTEVDALLNKKSGLKGICGVNDMREVLRRTNEDNQEANLALEMYTYRIKKYIGAYAAILPGVDAIVFTAGIGEHSAEIRARACDNLEHLGICIDPEKNKAERQGSLAIHVEGSAVKVLVVPTNEELEMAKQTLRCLEERP